MKTAVTVLQEMMVKLGQTPDYECISQSGPQHQATFEYRCAALGASVTAAARSKKEAKQLAARLMLRRLAGLGHAVPPPYAAPPHASGVGAGAGAGQAGDEAGASAAGAGEAGGGGGARSYVALLKELCEEYRLPGAEYELVGDTGPPHLRHFTILARVGHLTRQATATTKKAARQLAADQLYSYLRENLARLTKDFVEEDALVRAHEKAMERYQETREDARRPDLGQRVADYHLEPEAWDCALRALESEQAGGLDGALAALGLTAAATTLAAAGAAPLHVLTLDAAAPPLAFAGADPQRARAAAARYVRRVLARRAHAHGALG
ncbi:hypothetical protein ABMA28_016570 [Loxostege sticticalis]|uniref:DRBM domain-containing protein n=1 Tax=Loxostege sticticalis TaxID=481309 RepID=A0ABD0TCC0_LOXSC